jgi:hypothetical protein
MTPFLLGLDFRLFSLHQPKIECYNKDIEVNTYLTTYKQILTYYYYPKVNTKESNFITK